MTRADNIVRKLISLADRLDLRGLPKGANQVDALIKNAVWRGEQSSNEPNLTTWTDENPERKNFGEIMEHDTEISPEVSDDFIKISFEEMLKRIGDDSFGPKVANLP